jgi:hypothetical protein
MKKLMEKIDGTRTWVCADNCGFKPTLDRLKRPDVAEKIANITKDIIQEETEKQITGVRCFTALNGDFRTEITHTKTPQKPQNRVKTCISCDVPMVDKGGFYKCPQCGAFTRMK